MNNIMKLFGSEAFKTLAQLGLGLYQAHNANQFMDFQKGLMNANNIRAQGLYDAKLDDREATHRLDF